jgi:Flp pilus assembly protein TadD
MAGNGSGVVTASQPPADEPLADEGAPALGVVTGLPLTAQAEPAARFSVPEGPGHPASCSEVERLNRQACAAAAAKDYAGAIRGFQEAVALQPASWMLHYNLAAACLSASRYGDAEANLRQALALNRQCAPAWMQLAPMLSQQGRCRDALAAYDRVVELEPNNVAALNNAGLMLRQLGQFNAAKVTFARAVALAPDNPRTRFNHAILVDTAASRREALGDCRRCLEEDPRNPGLLSNLGVCHQLVGEFDAALAMFEQAIAADPDFHEAWFNRSLLRLGLGDFAAGWSEYERRWQLPQAEKPEFAAPLWDGGLLDGKTILLYAEQGFGDAIQFLRYVPLVAARGGRIVLRVHRALVRLAASLPGDIAIVTPGNRLPAFDVWCPLLSLPRLFETRLESIPGEVPYLRVRPALGERWRRRLADLSGLRVGLAWAGDPRHINDFRRSIELDRMAPLFDLAGISWVSLQTGPRAADLAAFSAARVRDLLPELSDFAETAGVIGNLDLVIAVDTAVAHLAGALAAPVWTMLPFSPDWRWMFERQDSPWYPTMRLFRQPTPGDWEAAVATVAKALAELTGQAGPPRK